MERPQTIQGSSSGSSYWEVVLNAAPQLHPFLKPLISDGQALQKTLNRGNQRKGGRNNSELTALCHTINSKYNEYMCTIFEDQSFITGL